MAAPSIEQRALSAASAVAARHGVPCEQAAVVHSGSNVLVHLRPAPVAARVMTGTVVLHDDPRRWLEREVSVLRFLAPSGLAVRPSPLIAAGPYQRDGLWLTFCEWVENRGSAELGADAENFGHVLRELHDKLARFDGELGDFLDVWRDIERLLRQLAPTDGLSPERIDALHERLLALRAPVFEAPLPAQALHGDVSLSNLLSTANGLVWSDFEDAFRGPVHWDVAGYMDSLRDRGADTEFVARMLDAYGWADETALTAFAAAHDLYGEIWGLYIAGRRAGLTGG